MAALVVVAAGLSQSALAQALPITGVARDATTGELLYTEQRLVLRQNGRITSAKVKYRDPGGQIFGHKRVDFGLSQTQPEVEITECSNGTLASLSFRDKRWILTRRDARSGTSRNTHVRWRDEPYIDDALLLMLGRQGAALADAGTRIALMTLDRSRPQYFDMQRGPADPARPGQLVVDLMRPRIMRSAVLERRYTLNAAGELESYVGPPTEPCDIYRGQVRIDYNS